MVANQRIGRLLSELALSYIPPSVTSTKESEKTKVTALDEKDKQDINANISATLQDLSQTSCSGPKWVDMFISTFIMRELHPRLFHLKPIGEGSGGSKQSSLESTFANRDSGGSLSDSWPANRTSSSSLVYAGLDKPLTDETDVNDDDSDSTKVNTGHNTKEHTAKPKPTVDEEDVDDVLFFVRQSLDESEMLARKLLQLGYEEGAQDVDFSSLDPEDGRPRILVKRRIGRELPELDDLISWKETFLLNCIHQLSFEMTVAVCERRTVPLEYQDFPLKGEHHRKYARRQSEPADPVLTNLAKSKKAMIPIKFITKRVYASPFKARMDKKTSGTELAYPHVYFQVNDFEDGFEDIVIQPWQYLCVELSCDLPVSPRVKKPRTLGEALHSLPGIIHVTLFQGAVPFQALKGTYQAKKDQSSGNTAFKVLQRMTKTLQTTFLSPTSSGTGDGLDGSNKGTISPSRTTSSEYRKRFGAVQDERQYVMMRGPNGKGHAQVAIKPATLRLLQSNQSQISISSSTFSLEDFPTPESPRHQSSEVHPRQSSSESYTVGSDGVNGQNKAVQNQSANRSDNISSSTTATSTATATAKSPDVPIAVSDTGTPIMQSFKRFSTQVFSSWTSTLTSSGAGGVSGNNATSKPITNNQANSSYGSSATSPPGVYEEPASDEFSPIDMGLSCFLTYIHLPWQTIIQDIFEHVIAESIPVPYSTATTDSPDI